MPRVRAGYTGKYKLTKHEFYTAYHFALNYKSWVAQRDALRGDQLKAIRYDKDIVQSSPLADGLERTAIRTAELNSKIRMIEESAKAADPDIWQWILAGVTEEGETYQSLNARHAIPCGKDMYYDRRRKFYWILAGKLLGQCRSQK